MCGVYVCYVCVQVYYKNTLVNNNEVNNQFDLLTHRSSARTHWFSRESSGTHETFYRSPEIALAYIVLLHSVHCGSCPLQKYPVKQSPVIKSSLTFAALCCSILI